MIWKRFMDLKKLNLPRSTFQYNGRETVYYIDGFIDIKTSIIDLLKPYIIAEENLKRAFFTIFNLSKENILIKFGKEISKNSFSIKLLPNQSYNSDNSNYSGVITAIIEK